MAVAGRRLLTLVVLLALGVPRGVAPAAELTPGASVAKRFLVASEGLRDPNFAASVVYMIEHDDEGAMGLVVNRVLAAGPLSDLLAGFGAEAPATGREIRVHYGGPVEPGRAFVLHSADYHHPETVVLTDEIALTASLDVLQDLAAGEGPERSLFAVGYAGWGAGQLESELASGAWEVVEADAELLFDDDAEGKWERALALRGVDL